MRILRDTKIVTHVGIDWDRREIEFTRQTRKYINGFWETEPRTKTTYKDFSMDSFMRLSRTIDRIGVMQVIDTGQHIMRNWFRFMSEDAKPHTYNYRTMTMTILPDLRMRLELTDEGRKIYEENMQDGTPELAVVDIMDDFHGPLCNGWTLDPDDDGRCQITRLGIGDDGEIDWKPGDVSWYDSMYALRTWPESAYNRGFAHFSLYYMGDLSLEDQQTII